MSDQAMNLLTAVLSSLALVAAVVSASAAKQSAKYAADAGAALEKQHKLNELTQLVSTASQVVILADQVPRVAVHLVAMIRSNAIAVGGKGGSIERRLTEDVESRLGRVKELSERAKPFLSGSLAMLSGPVEEVVVRRMDMQALLFEAQGLRDQLIREHDQSFEQLIQWRSSRADQQSV